MKLQRYDSVGFDLMDESPTGEFVRLEDVIELLESNATGEYKQVMLTPKLICEIKGEQSE